MSRLINVSDDVYKTLTRLKGKDSYSAAIRSMVSKKSNIGEILKFAGKDIIDEDKIKELKVGWKKWTDRYA